MANETNKRDFLFPRKKLELLLRIFFLVSNGLCCCCTQGNRWPIDILLFFTVSCLEPFSSSTSISLWLKERLFLISRWGSRCLFTWIRRKEINKKKEYFSFLYDILLALLGSSLLHHQKLLVWFSFFQMNRRHPFLLIVHRHFVSLEPSIRKRIEWAKILFNEVNKNVY